MEAIKTFRVGETMTAEIYHDPDPTNPRKEFDHLAEMVCRHGRYNLGDRQEGPYTEEELREAYPDILTVLPLYLYDHSGLTVATTPFGSRWDSGQIGWAFVRKEGAEKMGCVGQAWGEKQLKEAIVGEVEEYDSFLTGEVYGYRVKSPSGEELDSCWGFIGDMEYVESEALQAAKLCELVEFEKFEATSG